jgi:hypothetical protein
LKDKKPTTKMVVNFLQFKNAQSAWEGINKFMLQQETQILENGGAIYGPELISYNNLIRIKDMKVDPEFDFGHKLTYKDKKWSALVNNYCNFDYLDIIKAEIKIREKKKARSYNYAYHFNNHHGSGKDCLIALNFTRRVDHPNPVVVFEVRVSEVTQRLIFDFLLVQRMVEYVYGTEVKVEGHFFAPSMFITGERIMAFNNVTPLKKLLRKQIKTKTVTRFQRAVLNKLKKYSSVDPMSIQFRSFRRAAQVAQVDITTEKSLKAKDLSLFKNIETFPDEIVTPKHRAKFKREKTKAAKEIPVEVKKKKKKRRNK